jgi:hypothetical protein
MMDDTRRVEGGAAKDLLEGFPDIVAVGEQEFRDGAEGFFRRILRDEKDPEFFR